jgi:hypothetical protein
LGWSSIPDDDKSECGESGKAKSRFEAGATGIAKHFVHGHMSDTESDEPIGYFLGTGTWRDRLPRIPRPTER